MDKNIYVATLFKNSICVICWTILAIVFDKWGIALFALLFMTGVHTNHYSYRVCDKCGKHSPYANSYNEALEKAKEAGWIHCADSNRDYCPDCQ